MAGGNKRIENTAAFRVPSIVIFSTVLKQLVQKLYALFLTKIFDIVFVVCSFNVEKLKKFAAKKDHH